MNISLPKNNNLFPKLSFRRNSKDSNYKALGQIKEQLT